MIDWYKDAMSKYIVTEGRSGRSAFWYFVLANIVISILLHVCFSSSVFTKIYDLIVFIPTMTLSIRRLHDTGRLGWWYLLKFIPKVGWIIYFFFMIQPSQNFANEYGPKPN